MPLSSLIRRLIVKQRNSDRFRKKLEKDRKKIIIIGRTKTPSTTTNTTTRSKSGRLSMTAAMRALEKKKIR